MPNVGNGSVIYEVIRSNDTEHAEQGDCHMANGHERKPMEGGIPDTSLWLERDRSLPQKIFVHDCRGQSCGLRILQTEA